MYYTRIYPELGGRFYDEMERLIQEVRREPQRFRQFDPPAQRHFSNVFRMQLFMLSTRIGFGYWR